MYIINYCFKLRPLTLLILSATLALAALNNFTIAKPPLLINALNIQPTEAKATTNYSKDLATLAKIYTEESKYSKKDNNFNCKFIIFNNFYNRVNIL